MNNIATTTSLNDLTAPEAAVLGGMVGSIVVFSLIFAILLIIAGWKIFEKAGEKGWKILIPIYDLYILFKICGIKNWFWVMFGVTILSSILMCVNMPTFEVVEDWTGVHIDYASVDWSQYPTYIASIIISCVVGIVAEVMVAIKLAKAFGKGIGYTLGIIFLPNIFTLILGFGKAKYDKKAINA